MRDEEQCATLSSAVRSKVVEVARNGFAGATAGGEKAVLVFLGLFHDVSPHLPPVKSRWSTAASQAPLCALCCLCVVARICLQNTCEP